MKNKKYIGQVLFWLFTGMIIPIFLILASKYYIHIRKVNGHFMGIMGLVGISGFILEIFACSRFDKTKNKIWIFAQILFYFSYWIFMGVVFGTAYLRLCDIGYIVLYVYVFSIFITFICLIIGLCSKNIKFAKKGNIIWGFIISFLVIILGTVTKLFNRFVILALVFVVFLCCYYSVKQFNKLKSVKYFDSKAEQLSNVIDTAMDMGFTFVMLTLTILIILFPPSDDDND